MQYPSLLCAIRIACLYSSFTLHEQVCISTARRLYCACPSASELFGSRDAHMPHANPHVIPKGYMHKMSVKKHCGGKIIGTHDGTFHCDEVIITSQTQSHQFFVMYNSHVFMAGSGMLHVEEAARVQ